MSLSVSFVQLALTGAPPRSEIFVFTDATAKDLYLKSAVVALIEQTKSVVSTVPCWSAGVRLWSWAHAVTLLARRRTGCGL